MYCLIPKKLIKEKGIKPNAKLLYAVIAQQAVDMRCQRNNKWFANVFNVEKETISRWLTQLVNYGYIKREIISYVDEKNKTIIKRTLIIN